MAFWVYENIPTNHVTVHIGSCGLCNEGSGRRQSKYPSQSKWHGPFISEGEATAFADSTGRPVNTDRCCHRSTRTPRQAANARFQLPDVNEQFLSLEDLFHHRMLQLYVTLRESELQYSATRFLRSVRQHGGVEHAKRSLRRPVVGQTGLQRLRDAGMIDMSMEAYIVGAQFESLFTPWEQWQAKQRLEM